MSGGANVTVTIGAAFAGSFKSVLNEPDHDLKKFGRNTSRSMKAADKVSAGLGKSVAEIGKAARAAHSRGQGLQPEDHGAGWRNDRGS